MVSAISSIDASALAFHGRAARHDPLIFQCFLDLTTQQLEKVGLRLNYVAIEGAGWSGTLQLIKGTVARKLAETDFLNVSTIALAAVSEQTTNPAADRVASISLSYVAETGELLCCAVIAQELLPFGGGEYEELASLLIGLVSWDCGYGFLDKFNAAVFHVLALDPGDLTVEAYQSLSAWYDADLIERATKLRDIYPFNFLSRQQLDNPLVGGQTLRHLLQEKNMGLLTRFRKSDLWLWRIPQQDREGIRTQLVRHDALIV